MSVHQVNNQEAWNNAMRSLKSAEFLQSWDWGEFQRAMGREVLRLQFEAGLAQVIVHQLPLGLRYAYIPRCRISATGYQALFEYLAHWQFVFARVEPVIDLKSTAYKSKLVINRQPKDTLVINLNKPETELLGDMHPKTRYNIHLAEKKGVRVEKKKDISIFWQLHAETTKRDRFRGHERQYYELMLESPLAEQFVAFIGDKPIASHILLRFGDTCTYLHGASGDEARNSMAPYLLQWQGILFAKQAGYTYYDIWGVAPPTAVQDKIPSTCFHNYCWGAAHPWTGITRFKAGFGGIPKSYPSAVDITFSCWKYRAYQIARRCLGMV